jgi:hypothetical protein
VQNYILPIFWPCADGVTILKSKTRRLHQDQPGSKNTASGKMRLAS